MRDLQATRSPEWAATCQLYATAHWLPRWATPASITSASVRGYITARRAGVSPVTVRKELSALRRLLRWLHDRGELAELPTWEAPAGRSDYQPLCLTREQVQAVVQELPDAAHHPHHLPVREYYLTMWSTSFRRGTMARLLWSDIDLEAGTISVRAGADKRRHDRVVPLTEEARQALQALGPGVGLVFGRLDKEGRAKPRDYRASLEAAAARAVKAGVITAEDAQRLGNHSFRHARITDWFSRSRNVAAIQHMAGHSRLESTMRYLHGGLELARELLEEAGDQVAR